MPFWPMQKTSSDLELNLGTILVVDDKPDNLRLLSAMLSEQGYRARKALNGPMALRSVQAELPELILLDINMPEMNGYEVCQQLKADENTRDIPVIFISALDETRDKVRAFGVGGADYITKPFQNEEVLARVRHQISLRRLQQKLIEQAQMLEKQNIRLQREIEERQKVEKALRSEQEKSERLLLNILPAAIADRLKQNQGSLAERFDDVTVMFADIVGFTPLSARIPALELVILLNDIFSIFDNLTEQHGLEKIKTIGDAYMVAGGLPVPKDDHVEAVANMALDMQAAIQKFEAREWLPQGDRRESLQIRIGINTGPVVAGTIGTKKFIYDLWGDTVNVASRMESQGIPGRIQVTAATAERLKDKYIFEKRGEISVKGKGTTLAYWLIGAKI